MNRGNQKLSKKERKKVKEMRRKRQGKRTAYALEERQPVKEK